MTCPKCGYERYDGQTSHWHQGRETSGVMCHGGIPRRIVIEGVKPASVAVAVDEHCACVDDAPAVKPTKPKRVPKKEKPPRSSDRRRATSRKPLALISGASATRTSSKESSRASAGINRWADGLRSDIGRRRKLR